VTRKPARKKAALTRKPALKKAKPAQKKAKPAQKKAEVTRKTAQKKGETKFNLKTEEVCTKTAMKRASLQDENTNDVPTKKGRFEAYQPKDLIRAIVSSGV
jgi:hypothetical protein